MPDFVRNHDGLLAEATRDHGCDEASRSWVTAGAHCGQAQHAVAKGQARQEHRHIMLRQVRRITLEIVVETTKQPRASAGVYFATDSFDIVGVVKVVRDLA